MAAPKGNQFAAGNSGGRPKTRDPIAMAKALDEWSQREDALALVGFCAENSISAQSVSELRDLSEEFLEVLKVARARIANRLHTGAYNGKFNTAYILRMIGQYDKFIHDYDKTLRDEEHERKKDLIDYEIKSKSAVPQMSPEQMENLKMLNNQLTALQEAKKKK